jgi:hypothetical protein
VVLCPDVVPFIDHRFDCCDLLQRNVIHHGAGKPSGIRSWYSPNRSTPDYLFEKVDQCFRRSRTDSNVRVELEALGNAFMIKAVEAGWRGARQMQNSENSKAKSKPVKGQHSPPLPNPEILPLESLGDGPFNGIAERTALSGKGTIPVTRNAKDDRGVMTPLAKIAIFGRSPPPNFAPPLIAFQQHPRAGRKSVRIASLFSVFFGATCTSRSGSRTRSRPPDAKSQDRNYERSGGLEKFVWWKVEEK